MTKMNRLIGPDLLMFLNSSVLWASGCAYGFRTFEKVVCMVHFGQVNTLGFRQRVHYTFRKGRCAEPGVPE